jgi:hypothetical protein
MKEGIHLGGLDLEEVGVTGVLDRHDTDAVELTGGGAEVDVGTVVVVDRGLRAEWVRYRSKCHTIYSQHGVVLKLGLAKRGAVLRDEDELG